jgi:2-dehydro-3-deoxygluconokinase
MQQDLNNINEHIHPPLEDRDVKKVLCFGELLIRLCPDVNSQWLKQNNISIYVAGAEANAATNLALWGIPVSYLTVLPDNFLSKELLDYFKSKNVDASNIILQGERMGIYYLPKGADVKSVSVIYDRKNSSFSQLQPKTIDWENILKDVSWLHVSAITPALADNLVAVCKEAFQIASKKNIVISIDLNYRAKLWQDKNPIAVIPQLVQYCDVVMGNIWSAEKMLGITISEKINEQCTKEIYLQQAEVTSKKIRESVPKVKIVANTFRFDHGEKGINYYGTLYADNELLVSKEYFAERIIDKVGSGDCFMAGLIYGFYNKYFLQQALEFAAAAAFTKLFVESDITIKTVEDIKNCIANYDN